MGITVTCNRRQLICASFTVVVQSSENIEHYILEILNVSEHSMGMIRIEFTSTVKVSVGALVRLWGYVRETLWKEMKRLNGRLQKHLKVLDFITDLKRVFHLTE